jgi:hypothetical protein
MPSGSTGTADTIGALIMAAALTFYGDWNEDRRYSAVSFGQPWNGFDAPIVTREVLLQVIADSHGYAVTFSDDGTATVASFGPDNDAETNYAVMVPDASGNYGLRALGFTFYDAREANELAEFYGDPIPATVSTTGPTPEQIALVVADVRNDYPEFSVAQALQHARNMAHPFETTGGTPLADAYRAVQIAREGN